MEPISPSTRSVPQQPWRAAITLKMFGAFEEAVAAISKKHERQGLSADVLRPPAEAVCGQRLHLQELVVKVTARPGADATLLTSKIRGFIVAAIAHQERVRNRLADAGESIVDASGDLSNLKRINELLTFEVEASRDVPAKASSADDLLGRIDDLLGGDGYEPHR